jgi:hypothetical protein
MEEEKKVPLVAAVTSATNIFLTFLAKSRNLPEGIQRNNLFDAINNAIIFLRPHYQY